MASNPGNPFIKTCQLVILNIGHEVKTIGAQKCHSLIIWESQYFGENTQKRSKTAQNRVFWTSKDDQVVGFVGKWSKMKVFMIL